MNQKGLTLVETLVTAAILLAVIIATLTMFQKPIAGQKNINAQTNFYLVRNNILNVIHNSGAWKQTIQGASNQSAFRCFVKQDSIVDAERNCSQTTSDLDIYDLKGNLLYEFSKPEFGIQADGTPCPAGSQFQATPPGNPLCPLRVSIKMQPLCPTTPCENPTMQVTGDFIYNSPNPLPLNLELMKFKMLRSGFYCPTQATPALAVQGTNVALNGTQAAATVSGKVIITGNVHYTNRLLPCQSVMFNFNYALGASDLDGDSVPDTEGVARVCLMHPTLGCQYAIQIRPGAVPTFDILYQGAIVMQKPAAFNLVSSSNLGFKIFNGRVQVCFEGNCFYSYLQKLGAPFDVEYRPASTSYSSGFTNLMLPIIFSL